MRKVLLRAIHKHQILVLNELKKRGNYLSVTSMIREISNKYSIPESSLRLYVKQLKELDLINYDTSSSKLPVKLTKDGDLILKMIGGDKE